MKKMAIIRVMLLTALLIAVGYRESVAQVSRHRDEGTAKRSYGDAIPRSEDGSSPGWQGMKITDAAQSGGLAEARGAFLRGDSVNSRTARGAPAVLLAAQSGNIAVLRFLLEKGANPDLFEKSSGKTALIAAAQAGEGSMVHMLLEHKADPNHQDRQGETALIKAARVGAVDAVQSLLGSGVDLNATDYAGHTALWHARDARRSRIAQIIEAAGGK